MLCLKRKKEERRNSNQIRFLFPMQMLLEPRACRVEVVFGGPGQSLIIKCRVIINMYVEEWPSRE